MYGQIPSSSLLIALLVSVLTAGCSVHAHLDGVRPITAADRAAPEVGRYLCMTTQPTISGMEGVHETTSKLEIEVHATDKGLVLMQGAATSDAWFNHWQTEHADHFFVWSADIGTEILVNRDGSGAAQYTWSSQAKDPTAYRIDKQADGTTRPHGVPTSVYWCYPSPQIELRRSAGQPLLVRSGATAVELRGRKSVSNAHELIDLGCSHEGATAKHIRTEKFGFGQSLTYYYSADTGLINKSQVTTEVGFLEGPYWEWMPSGMYLPPDQKQVAYVGFARHAYKWNRHFYKVDVTTDGQFTFTLGQAKYTGQIEVSSSGKNVVELHGQLDDDSPGDLWCTYVEWQDDNFTPL